MPYRWNKGHDDDKSTELWPVIVAILITIPLVVLLFAQASGDPDLIPTSTAERPPMVTSIVLPPR